MDTHIGSVQITDDASNPTIVIDGNQQEIRLGSEAGSGTPVRLTLIDGVDAEVRVWRTGAQTNLTLTVTRTSPAGSTDIGPGSITTRGSGTQPQGQLSGNGLELWDGSGRKRASLSRVGRLLLSDTAEKGRLDLRGANGDMSLFDASGVRRAWLSSNGRLRLFDADSKQTVSVNATNGDLQLQEPGGQNTIRLLASDGTMRAGGGGKDGRILVRDKSGTATLDLRGQNGDVLLQDATGNNTIRLFANDGSMRAGGGGKHGRVLVRNQTGTATIDLRSQNGDVLLQENGGQNTIRLLANDATIRAGGGGKNGRMLVRNQAGATTIDLDGASGDIRLSGADCAENFHVAEQQEIEPGTVVVSQGGEEVAPCAAAYDRRAVGVVAGAGDYRPAIRLAATGAEEGQVPVALMGRVYCKVDAGYGAVDVGDLLTTSPTPGHAMRASEPGQAFGAVLGKALGRLDTGRELVPILVALQ
jgi:hypothetical protein